MRDNFFNKIVYSASNEDSESERRSLQIGPGDNVLCITGSGARTLDLLVDSPRKIVSIDQNRLQNYLLELKIAAYRTLEYSRFLQFLGVTASRERRLIYRQVAVSLPAEAREWWDNNQSLVDEGVLWCGKWEKLLGGLRTFSFFARGRIDGLMNAWDLAEQVKTWNREWDTPAFKLFLKIISNRFLWVKIIREPGAALIPADFNIYGYLLQRLGYLATTFELKKNHFASLLFYGRYRNDVILPQHLRRENFNIIRQNLESIEIVTSGLGEYLGSEEELFSAFSLSDFSSYTPADEYISVWDKIVKSAKDGARFCERQFMVKMNPEAHNRAITRKRLLEESLNKFDETALYSFIAGSINKNREDE